MQHNTHIRIHAHTKTDIVVVHVHLLLYRYVSTHVRTYVRMYVCMYVLGDAFLPRPPHPSLDNFDKADASPLSPPKQHKIPKKYLEGFVCWKMQALGPHFGPLFFFFPTLDNNNQAYICLFFFFYFPIFANATSHPLSWPLPPGREEGHLTTAKQTNLSCPVSTRFFFFLLSHLLVPQMGQAGVACRAAGEGETGGEKSHAALSTPRTCGIVLHVWHTTWRSKRKRKKTGNVG